MNFTQRSRKRTTCPTGPIVRVSEATPQFVTGDSGRIIGALLINRVRGTAAVTGSCSASPAASRCCSAGRAELRASCCWEAAVRPGNRHGTTQPLPGWTCGASTRPSPPRSPPRKTWTSRNWRKTCRNTQKFRSEVRPTRFRPAIKTYHKHAQGA